MNKMKFVFGALILSASTLVGCNSVNTIGSIDGVRYEAVRSNDLFGPSGLAIVRVDEAGQSVVGTFASEGAFPSLVGAAGDVVAAEVMDADSHSTSVSGSVRVKQNNGHRGPITPANP